jgi:hypothetical protein
MFSDVFLRFSFLYRFFFVVFSLFFPAGGNGSGGPIVKQNKRDIPKQNINESQTKVKHYSSESQTKVKRKSSNSQTKVKRKSSESQAIVKRRSSESQAKVKR